MGYNTEKDFDRTLIGQYLYDVTYLLSEVTTWEDLEAYIHVDGDQRDMTNSVSIDALKKQYSNVNEAVDSVLWNYCCYNIARCWTNSKEC
jgi:hypothetical protein